MNFNISNLIGDKAAVAADVSRRTEIPQNWRDAIASTLAEIGATGCRIDVHAQTFNGTVNIHVTASPVNIAAPVDLAASLETQPQPN
jgi:hypothetical protein